jgi:hypothetical protein
LCGILLSATFRNFTTVRWYSPFVLRRVFERHGYAIVAEGSTDDIQPPGLKRNLRGLLYQKILALPPEMAFRRRKLLRNRRPAERRDAERRS